MIWPFRKRKPQVIDRRRMNEDWAPGDLAECVYAGAWIRPEPHDPRKGEVLRVTRVEDRIGLGGIRCYVLVFASKPATIGYECTAFRKLRPVIEPAEDEFRQFLKDSLRGPVQA